jgi:hypothetical protein
MVEKRKSAIVGWVIAKISSAIAISEHRAI